MKRHSARHDAAAPPDVLFVSHEASLTGAPIVLLHLLRWLRRAHPEVAFETALLARGPLESEFRRLGPVHLLGSDRGWWPARTPLERGLDQFGWSVTAEWMHRLRVTRRVRNVPAAPIVYLNSVVSTPLLRYLPSRPRCAVCHVHEMASTRQEGLRPQDWSLLADQVDLVVAAAAPVRDVVVGQWGVQPARVTVVEEFVTVDGFTRPDESVVNEHRRRFGIEPGDLVVGGAGTLSWRKGPDLFVQLAGMVSRRSGSAVHFVWVGEELLEVERERLLADVRRSDLADRGHFVGQHPHPAELFAMADVLALTSREDPFPLVVLEHALLDVPVVCFDGSGGIPGFVRQGSCGEAAGISVPYLDVEAMAGAVQRLLVDQPLQQALGERAAAAVRTDHDVEVQAPRIWSAVTRMAGAGHG